MQYIIALLITVLEDLSTTYAMRVAEDTTYEKATSMSSVVSNLIIFLLLMH